jgi:hypothetical protein
VTGPGDAHVEFCGEDYTAVAGQPFKIGREGDLTVDDNPYLHRQFLMLHHQSGYWQLSNVGSQLAATIADDRGLVQAWLSPGASLPLVFPATRVWFTAGPTTYEFTVTLDDPPFLPVSLDQQVSGATTLGPGTLTADQHLLLVALAEVVLRRGEQGAGRIPSNADAATRLGWTLTKFNRKLDNVCDKFSRHGVRGLHGDATRLASTRRARLVEYALAARLVTAGDLDLLPSAKSPESRV